MAQIPLTLSDLEDWRVFFVWAILLFYYRLWLNLCVVNVQMC